MHCCFQLLRFAAVFINGFSAAGQILGKSLGAANAFKQWAPRLFYVALGNVSCLVYTLDPVLRGLDKRFQRTWIDIDACNRVLLGSFFKQLWLIRTCLRLARYVQRQQVFRKPRLPLSSG